MGSFVTGTSIVQPATKQFYKITEYEVCLKSNRTVYAARTTFIAEKKALLTMMSQCLLVSNTKFQHSVTTAFFFARFSVKALFL